MVSRGNGWSAAANLFGKPRSGRPRRLQVVARTVDRAQPVGGEDVGNAVRAGADQRLAVVRDPSRGWGSAGMTGSSVSLPCKTFECRSAILICFRMNARSPGVMVNPWPTSGGAAAAGRRDRHDADGNRDQRAQLTSLANALAASNRRRGTAKGRPGDIAGKWYPPRPEIRCQEPAARIPYLGETTAHPRHGNSFPPVLGRTGPPGYGEPPPGPLPEYSH